MIRIVGVMRARNEAWVFPCTARAALTWVDALILLDHASTDRTLREMMDLRAIYPGRVYLYAESSPAWHEMAQLNRLLWLARDFKATHIAIIDADEILTANLVPRIRAVAEHMAPGEMLRVPWHNLWRDLDAYRDDSSKHGKQRVSWLFCDAPGLAWPKDERFNHRSPLGIAADIEWPPERDAGGVMHLQRVVWRRASHRQRLYKMREVLRGQEPVEMIDARYSSSLSEEGAILKPVPEEWWAGIDRRLIDLDAEPWEVEACADMIAAHGRDRFAGLAL